MRISDWMSDVCSSDLVQADGVNVEPVTVDEFRFGPGETYDILVEPKDDTYTVFAQAMDRTGYARGTLATRAGLDAPVPTLDPVEWLTMADMMGSMGAGLAGMSHGAAGQSSLGSMDHGHMAGMNHCRMAGMIQSGMEGVAHGAKSDNGRRPPHT